MHLGSKSIGPVYIHAKNTDRHYLRSPRKFLIIWRCISKALADEDTFKVSPKLASKAESSPRAKRRPSGICKELQRRTRHRGAEQSCGFPA